MRTNFLPYPSEIHSPPNSQLTPTPSSVRSGADRLRLTTRFQILVAPRQIRAATGGIVDLIVGAAAGDTLPSINRRIREPLRVEFGGGELESGGSIVGWPLAADQWYNARMLTEEMGVCVEVARGVENDVGIEDVRRAIEAVMGGAEMRRKAAESGELIRAALMEDSVQKWSSLQEEEDLWVFWSVWFLKP